MIRSVTLSNFKRFRNQTFELDDHIVLAGPNNSGKSTLIQAIVIWQLALRRWIQQRGDKTRTVRERAGVPITRKDFTAIPLREMKLLWPDCATSLKKEELGEGQNPGHPRLMHIGLRGELSGAEWELEIELRFQNSEQIYVKPTGSAIETIPEAVRDMRVVHVPPFSGIGAEETRYDRPYQDLLVGQGKAGDILRNLLLEIHSAQAGEPAHGGWERLVAQIREIFGYTLLPPEYDGRPYIICDYLPGHPEARNGHGGYPRLDIAVAGSGFHQVLLLLAFFHARPASVLLLDEPDAHLHVILQRQIYERLKSAAAERQCQLIIVTHSEVIIDSTSPDRIESFFGRPHRLVRKADRDQLREAIRQATAMDLVAAERSEGVLYLESEGDLAVLRAWSELLDHPMREWFARIGFCHYLHGSDPADARRHFFAVRAVAPELAGCLLLDGDNRQRPDHEVTGEGLLVQRWRRYEIESYLFVPEALIRFIRNAGRENELIAAAAESYMKDQVPPAVYREPLGDHSFLQREPISKGLLPEFLDRAQCDLPKRDYYRLAESMKRDEIHPEVIEKLDRMATAFDISGGVAADDA